MSGTFERVRARHVLWTSFLNSPSTLDQYFVLPSKGSKYYLMYTFKAVHVLRIWNPGTSQVRTIERHVNKAPHGRNSIVNCCDAGTFAPSDESTIIDKWQKGLDHSLSKKGTEHNPACSRLISYVPPMFDDLNSRPQTYFWWEAIASLQFGSPDCLMSIQWHVRSKLYFTGVVRCWLIEIFRKTLNLSFKH